METTPGDSSDWEDRNVAHYALFGDQNSLLSLTLSKWRRAAIILTPPYLWKKSKNMNTYLYNKLCKDYSNKFIPLNCWIKIREKFQVTLDGAETKYNYIRNSLAAIFHSIWRENIKLGSRSCPVHSTSQSIWRRSNGNNILHFQSMNEIVWRAWVYSCLCNHGSTGKEPVRRVMIGKNWQFPLNAIPNPQFRVTQRSVRDHYSTMEKRRRTKVRGEDRASGIAPEEDKELEQLLDEIMQLFDESDKAIDETKQKQEEEVKEADEMRKRSLETFEESAKRNGDEQQGAKQWKTRARVANTMAYLKERAETEATLTFEKLEIKSKRARGKTTAIWHDEQAN